MPDWLCLRWSELKLLSRVWNCSVASVYFRSPISDSTMSSTSLQLASFLLIATPKNRKLKIWGYRIYAFIYSYQNLELNHVHLQISPKVQELSFHFRNAYARRQAGCLCLQILVMLLMWGMIWFDVILIRKDMISNDVIWNDKIRHGIYLCLWHIGMSGYECVVVPSSLLFKNLTNHGLYHPYLLLPVLSLKTHPHR